MTEYSKGRYAYFVCAAFIDALAIAFFAVAFCATFYDTEYISLPGAFILTFGCLLAVSVTAAVRTRKGKQKIIINTILMKLTILFFGIAVSFLSFEDGIYAFSVFTLGGVIFMISALLHVYDLKRRARHAYRSGPSGRRPFEFNGKEEYEKAAEEYRRLYGLMPENVLTEEQSARVREYAVGPFSYLFYWLAVNGKLSGKCLNRFHTQDFIEQLRAHRLSPVEALRQIDAYIGENDLQPEIIPFLKSYFDVRYYSLLDCDITNSLYLYDYCEVAGCSEARYYCTEFAWNTAEQLRLKIHEAYEAWAVFQNEEYYEEYKTPLVSPVKSAHFNTDLEVNATGIKKHGFPGGAEEYARRCVKCLDAIDASQWRRLNQNLVENHYCMTTENPLEHFRPNSIVMIEPQNEGDVVFHVDGEAGFDEEHGFSFAVRNGVIVGCGASCDYDDIYGNQYESVYAQMQEGIRYDEILDEAAAAPYVAAGRLVKVQLLPYINGCISSGDREYIYLPPKAAKQKELAEQCLRCLLAAFGPHRTKYTIYCGSVVVGEPEPLVPKKITISPENMKNSPMYSATIYVWE